MLGYNEKDGLYPVTLAFHFIDGDDDFGFSTQLAFDLKFFRPPTSASPYSLVQVSLPRGWQLAHPDTFAAWAHVWIDEASVSLGLHETFWTDNDTGSSRRAVIVKGLYTHLVSWGQKTTTTGLLLEEDE
jgi:hypothetical protein